MAAFVDKHARMVSEIDYLIVNFFKYVVTLIAFYNSAKM